MIVWVNIVMDRTVVDSDWHFNNMCSSSGQKNVLRKLLHIPYRRLKAGFSVTVFE